MTGWRLIPATHSEGYRRDPDRRSADPRGGSAFSGAVVGPRVQRPTVAHAGMWQFADPALVWLHLMLDVAGSRGPRKASAS
jgi:hypothetical protein